MQVAMVFNTLVTPAELFQTILREFDIYDYRKTKGECYQMLCDYFLDQFSRGNRCLVFIDEAQNLTPTGMEEIRMLSNLNEGNDTLVQVILAGQPSLMLKLEHKHMRQFAQRVTTEFVLEPLEAEEVRNYVAHRMSVAGRNSNNGLFTPDAFQKIYRYSKGIPRLINILCDGALVYGYADELDFISGAVIDEVVKDKKIKGQFFTEQPAGQAPVKPPGPPGPATEARADSLRLDRLEAQFRELRDNGNGHTVQELEKLLAAERERADRATHECGQRDMTIRMLKSRVEKLEKLRNGKE
jgi:general secretion pathway protein A